MSDIVERLRDRKPSEHLSFGPWKLCEEAADEIERLRAGNSALVATLKEPDQVGYWQRRCELAEEKLRARDEQTGRPDQPQTENNSGGTT